MGEIKRVLTQGRYCASDMPYADRLVIEDCVGETVHLHMGNIRTEFSPEQFLWFAGHVADAAQALKTARGL